jgi:PST family polysaccharide transporter
MKSSVAARGALTTLTGQGMKYLVQMTALVVLARLLTPSDYGLVAMVSAVVGIAMVIGDFGLGLSAVQAHTLSTGQRNNLFWVNSLIGACAGITVFLSGPALADFYQEPRLRDITAALSMTFVLNGLASQFRAELARSLKFVALTTVDVCAQVVSFGLAILLAVLGAGFWALVTQQVCFAAVTLIGLAATAGWRPGLPKRNARMGSLYSFGVSTFVTQTINYISSNVDSVALGRYSGSAELGIYNRAFQIFSLPLQQLAAPLTRVALPILSKITDASLYQRYVERIQLVLSYFLVGTLACVATTSTPLIYVVLGPQWVPGAGILEILCLGGIFQALGYVYYWICLSRARMGTLLVCEGVGRGIMIVLIIFAAPHGASTVAAAVSCGLFITWLVTTIFGMPRLGLDASRLIKIAAVPTIIFVLTYALSKTLALTGIFAQLTPLALLAVLGAFFALCFVLACLLPQVRSDLSILRSTVASAVSRKAGSKRNSRSKGRHVAVKNL